MIVRPPTMPCDMPERPEAEQAAYFEQVFERTRQAIARAGGIAHDYALAGVRIRIVFAGPALEPLFTAAIAHLRVNTPWDTVDATFHVWDSDSTGVAMPPPPCSRTCLTARGDIWTMTSEQVRLAFHWSEFAVNLNRAATGDFIHWVQGVDSVPYWAKASPLRTLFHWLMRSRGAHLLHGAAIATDAGSGDGAVLLTGRGGIGKSTTALACLSAGLRYIGDDYLVVALEPEPRAISLYATAKLNADQTARFPAFAPLIVNRATMAEEKAVLLLYPDQGGYFCAEAPLRALLTPEFAGGPATAFAPVTRRRLHAAASFTTFAQLPHAGSASDDFINRLIAAVPGYTIRLGTDLAALPQAIARVIRAPHDVLPPAAKAARVPSRPPPRVSVVIPVHNAARFVPEAVASVLDQNHPAIEILVVDDGSTDDLPDVVRALPVPVRFFRQDQRGPAAARNVGIRAATGDFIAFIDADDLWPRGTLTTLLDEMAGADGAAPDVVGGYGQLFRRDRDGAVRFIGNPEEGFKTYIGAALYRRSIFDRNGLFDENLTFAEDTDWYLRAAHAGFDVRRLPLVCLLVRRHEQNMTRGRSLAELNSIRLMKKELERRLRRTAEPTEAG